MNVKRIEMVIARYAVISPLTGKTVYLLCTALQNFFVQIKLRFLCLSIYKCVVFFLPGYFICEC